MSIHNLFVDPGEGEFMDIDELNRRRMGEMYLRRRVPLLALIHEEFPKVPSHAREDIVQTAFTRAWRRHQSFSRKSDDEQIGYLYKTVRRLCLDYFRDEDSRNRIWLKWAGRTGRDYFHVVGGAIVEAGEEDPEFAVLVETLDLIAMIEELPPTQKIAAYDRFLRDLVASDIEALYGPEAMRKYKANLHRAFMALRGLYESANGDAQSTAGGRP